MVPEILAERDHSPLAMVLLAAGVLNVFAPLAELLGALQGSDPDAALEDLDPGAGLGEDVQRPGRFDPVEAALRRRFRGSLRRFEPALEVPERLRESCGPLDGIILVP